METSYNYKNGSGFDIKAKAAAETFAHQNVEKEKLWYFEQSELCARIHVSFQEGNRAAHPAHLSACVLHSLSQQRAAAASFVMRKRHQQPLAFERRKCNFMVV